MSDADTVAVASTLACVRYRQAPGTCTRIDGAWSCPTQNEQAFELCLKHCATRSACSALVYPGGADGSSCYLQHAAADNGTATPGAAELARCVTWAVRQKHSIPGGPDLPVIVMNLDRSTDRLANMTRMLARAGIANWTRHPATYGRTLKVSRLQQLGVVHPKQPPALGNIGTALTHMRVWTKLAAGAYGADRALIFEDDATLKPGGSARLGSAGLGSAQFHWAWLDGAALGWAGLHPYLLHP